MRLLVVTQAVDRNDQTLGFFHDWICAFASRVERLTVVCLYEDDHDLPSNVRVHSLGKERGASSRLRYASRFLGLAWRLRRDYDTVFVHMNQEYVLIAGWLWRLLGKRVYLWRNHRMGSVLTELASLFCTNIFCTSRYSYTAKYKKTMIMPVGIDIRRFGSNSAVSRIPRSILFFSRIAPVKQPHVVIDALGLLAQNEFEFTASIYGNYRSEDRSYYDSLVQAVRDKNLTDKVSFHAGVTYEQAPGLYETHDIFVNATPPGSFDKTLIEAAAAGCIVIASNTDFRDEAGYEAYFTAGNSTDLFNKLVAALSMSENERESLREKLEGIADKNSTTVLMEALFKVLV